MARRKKYSQKEYDELQKLKYENKMLKKKVSALRKQISRIDLDRYESLRDLVIKQDREDIKAQAKEKLKTKWQCYNCSKGFLKLHILSRRDGVFYFRKCVECDHRTVTKPYTEEVEGDE